MHEYLNPGSPKCPFPKFAEKVLKYDKSLWKTKFGNFVSKIINAKEVDVITTDIKSIHYTDAMPKYVTAPIIKSKNLFGDLTARALLRTTNYGVLSLGILGGVHTKHRVEEGFNPKDEFAKSLIKASATIIGVGYLGAIGAKYYGAVGSLIGTAIGTTIGENTPNLIDKIN